MGDAQRSNIGVLSLLPLPMGTPMTPFVDWHGPYDDDPPPDPLLTSAEAGLVAEMLHQTHPFSTPKPIDPVADGEQPELPPLVDYGAPIPDPT